MNSIPIVLGGRTYTVQRLPIRPHSRWLETARPLVEPVADMAMAAGIAQPTPERLVKFAFTSALFIDPMAVLNAVLNYAPNMAEDRDWIEMHAYPDEALTALLTLFFGMQEMSPTNGAAPKQHKTTSTN